MTFLIFAIVFGALYLIADATVPAIDVTRNGGLIFFRCGRFGGSFYLAKSRRER